MKWNLFCQVLHKVHVHHSSLLEIFVIICVLNMKQLYL